MIKRRLICFTMMLVAGGYLACQGSTKPLEHASLLNMQYLIPSPPPDFAVVHDGKWSSDDSDGHRSLTIVDDNVRGDLDGDGRTDAVVLLVYSGGGSGGFKYLAAVLNENGQPHHVASVELGDRVKVKSLAVSMRLVKADLLVQGENDPMCCPSQPATRTYELLGKSLVERGPG